MKTQNYNIIGVMSGTSLDGVDLTHIHFTYTENKWSFDLLECETVSYTSQWVQILKIAVDFDDHQLEILNQDYTKLLADIINNFIKKHNISNIDAVCSHGHTILHQPKNGLTLQIGNLPEIASLIQQKVVCDFRVQDVQMGGQGAPLVPIGDKILFANYDYCLNLGGFSNISFNQNSTRIAFDISPVNTVLNYYAEKLGFPFDDSGKISKSGTINNQLLETLNALEYYQKPYPKSLGFEFVKQIFLPKIEQFNCTLEDKMRTVTEHVVQQIKLALDCFETHNDKSANIFVTGGGAYNDFLIERMQSYLPNIMIEIPSPKILEFKEALIFGLLGVLKLRNEINVLSSVTGAKHDHSSGKIY